MAIFTVISGTPGTQGAPIVGDFNIYLTNRLDKVLSTLMFTSLTSPVFSDPASNTPTFVKILSLPANPNVLLYNGIAVTINQEISFTDIQNGLLIYDAPDQDAMANNFFTFSLKVDNSFLLCLI